jgi:hypothetical protein
MPRIEMELGDRRLDSLAEDAYYQRQQGSIQQWTAKLAYLKSEKLEELSGSEVARIKSDIAICEQELAKIDQELKLAQQLGSPGMARQQLKHPVSFRASPKR